MNKVFIDTTAFIAIGNKDDELHKKAVEVNQNLLSERVKLITTSEVFIEVANTFCKSMFRSFALKLIDSFRNLIPFNLAEEIHIDKYLLDSGIEFYGKYSDKDWSLTDCISFIVMDEFNIKDSFTSDKHFKQAGFNILL